MKVFQKLIFATPPSLSSSIPTAPPQVCSSDRLGCSPLVSVYLLGLVVQTLNSLLSLAKVVLMLYTACNSPWDVFR